MDMRTIENALLFAQKLGIKDIRLTGGEPTIHPNFINIIENIYGKGYQIGLISNGVNLIRNNKYSDAIKKIDRLWLSVYSPKESKHHQIAGQHALSTDNILAFAAKSIRNNNFVGISCLLTPGDSCSVVSFIDRCLSVGVKRLRFLPFEPEGRAATLIPKNDILKFREECYEIYKTLQKYNSSQFQHLSINNPFDLGLEFASDPTSSCLLTKRKMYSITPDASIYNCCFNAYEISAKLGKCESDLDLSIYEDNATSLKIGCKGLDKTYWGSLIGNTTCPIRGLNVIKNCY